jgi:hypothetical protein
VYKNSPAYNFWDLQNHNRLTFVPLATGNDGNAHQRLVIAQHRNVVDSGQGYFVRPFTHR